MDLIVKYATCTKAELDKVLTRHSFMNGFIEIGDKAAFG